MRSNSAELLDWRLSPITGGAGGGAFQTAVYRFLGRARNGKTTTRWSLILKVLQADRNADPAASHYWKREAEAYRSGLLDDLPEGIAAPRLCGTAEFEGESCWLWLEDVSSSTRKWRVTRYGLAARHLGRLSGSYLAAKPIPVWPWLSSGWIRKDLAAIESEADRLRTNLDQPLMQRFFPGDAARKMLRLLEEREIFLTALEGLPQTLCHFDAFRRNMFARRARGRDETVLIDWAFVGVGPIGADIVSLVWVSLAMFELDSDMAASLDRVAFAGYLSGLRDAGWEGDERQVRLGFTAAIALRRIGTFGYILPWILDPSQHALFEQVGRHSIGEAADNFARVGDYVEKLADEARRLLTTVS